MARRERPGLNTAESLPQAQRAVVEPILELVGRMAGMTLPQIEVDVSYVTVQSLIDAGLLTAPLAGAATLAQTITKVNELQAIIENHITITAQNQRRLNDVINRLQKD
jgi:hypothetical protein